MIGWMRRLFNRSEDPQVSSEEISRAEKELKLARAVLQRSRIEEAEGRRLAESLHALRSQNHFAAAMRKQIWEGQR